MTTPGWAILSAVIYLVLIFTLALMTFRKGHWVLGIIGFIFPLLWLIGAIMPAGGATADSAAGGSANCGITASFTGGGRRGPLAGRR